MLAADGRGRQVQGGLWAPAGGVGKVIHVDTVTPANGWVWPASKKQVSDGPEDFIHII